MIHPLLLKAAEIAANFTPDDPRNFVLGALGVREDGAIVVAKNGAVISSTYDEYRIISDAHAECRCLKKLGKNGTLFVARVLKKDGSLACSRPCLHCRLRIKIAKVSRVYYTIDPAHYGVWYPKFDVDRVYDA